MTTTTTVLIRPGRDWCQAEGHEDNPPSPMEGIYIKDTFVCWKCWATVMGWADLVRQIERKP